MRELNEQSEQYYAGVLGERWYVERTCGQLGTCLGTLSNDEARDFEPTVAIHMHPDVARHIAELHNAALDATRCEPDATHIVIPVPHTRRPLEATMLLPGIREQLESSERAAEQDPDWGDPFA